MTQSLQRKLNILFTQDFDPVELGGTRQNNTLAVANQLQKNGAQCTLASPEARTTETLLSGVQIKKLTSNTDLIDCIGKSAKVVPVVNLSSNNKPLSSFVQQSCAIFDVSYYPWVKTTHKNAVFNKIAGTSDFSQSLYLSVLVTGMQSEMCKKVMCVSQSAAESIVSLGVPMSKIMVVKNSVNIKSATTNTKKYDVMFIGRLSPEKGTVFMMYVLKLVMNKLPNFTALMVGNGRDKAILESIAKALGISKNLTFISELPNNEVQRLLSETKVLVNTSLTESFGLAILEAMALGTPVVVPNIEGPKELTQNGKYGWVYETGDTKLAANLVVKCIENAPIVQKKALLAKNYAEISFSLEQQVKSFIRVLNL